MKGPPARHSEEPREQLPAVEGVISDASELKPGDRVVYPNQGVCAITGIEQKDIAGQKLELVRMEREEDGAAVLVPRAKVPSIGLRRVATGDQIEGVFHYLGAVFDDPELDWKIRHRDNADRLIAGGVLGVAEVVKGLHSLSRIRPLPAKEREQYDNARHLLVHEVAVSLGVPPGLAEDYIDYALMPPPGVKFDLKPPPTPVLLPSRPKRRKPVGEEAEDDLGLGELGIDLGGVDLEAALPGLPAEEGEAEAEDAEGEAEKPAEAAEEHEAEEEPVAAEAEAEEEEAAAPTPAKRRKPKAPKTAARKPAAKKAPARKAAAPKKPAAKKPAAKPAAKKPARGGKKK